MMNAGNDQDQQPPKQPVQFFAPQLRLDSQLTLRFYCVPASLLVSPPSTRLACVTGPIGDELDDMQLFSSGRPQVAR